MAIISKTNFCLLVDINKELFSDDEFTLQDESNAPKEWNKYKLYDDDRYWYYTYMCHPDFEEELLDYSRWNCGTTIMTQVLGTKTIDDEKQII